MTMKGCILSFVIRNPWIAPSAVPASMMTATASAQFILVGGQQVDEDDAEQGEHGADRQVDAAGDDDEALADREDAEQADEVGRVRQVDGRDEARIEIRDDRRR